MRVTNLVAGRFGDHCAQELGLTVSKPRLHAGTQTGPSLLDLLPQEDPEDHCDGFDR